MPTVLPRAAAALFLSILASQYLRADAPAAPTPDEAQNFFDTGDYANTLKSARRALAITGSAAEAYNRHALFMLAAESSLHLKQTSVAIDLLHTAQKEGEKAEHPTEAAEAIAFATLIQNSPNNTYSAKEDGATNKYDILDKTTRHQAYEALFTDQKNHCEARIQAAQQATSLTPILDLAKMYTVTRAVELAASGNTKRSDLLANEAERWASNLISNTEDGYDGRISRIQLDSNVNALGKIRPRRPAGISDADIASLHQIIADCQKIPPAITAFTTAFVRPNAMAHQTARAKDLSDRANTTLQQNFRVGNGKS